MNLAIYVLVYDYINNAINDFMTHLMTRLMGVVASAAVLVVTVWVMLVGYRAITGTEPLREFRRLLGVSQAAMARPVLCR